MRRETVRSLPGMARAERTTVSPGPAATSRCSPTLIMESAESGSPWLPDTKTTARSPALARERAGGDSGRLREAQEAEVERHLGVVQHAAAEEGDRPAGPDREVGHALDAGDRGREAGDEHAPARPLEDLLERGHDGVLAAGEPRLLDVGAVREEGQDAAVAPLRERVDVGALVRRGRGVDLEVAARHHDPGRRLDREGEAVEDAVRDADRVHAERPDLDGLAGHEGAQVGVRRRAPASRLRAKPRVRRLP